MLPMEKAYVRLMLMNNSNYIWPYPLADLGENKLLCCAAYILNLIVSICLSCWPNLWWSGVFSAEFRSFRKNSAEPDISRKYGSASRIFWKNPAEGSTLYWVPFYFESGIFILK